MPVRIADRRQLAARRRPGQARIGGALLLAVLLGLAGGAHAGPLTVCTFSFHGPDEIRVFEDRLSPDDFEVVDLGPHRLDGPPPPDAAAPGSWLRDLCRPDLRCDVVVYSAEFAGSFFGAYGRTLSLADMEEASCRPECAGLFHAAQEVFLLGCNTLATKGQDRRTRRDYLDVLREHGFDRAAAERVVEMRYGALGPSFRESFRRVFAGVPRLYGFPSVAPTAEYTAPLLERYLARTGDYAHHLDAAEGSTAPNAVLLRTFERTGLVQTSGLMPSEPAYADRERVCRIHDESVPVARRLRMLRALMDRPDFLDFLPTLQRFIDRHPADRFDAEAARAFDDVRHADAARDEVLDLVHQLDVSALQLELAHLARHLGWLPPAAFRRLAVDSARTLLGRLLTSDMVDVMCAIAWHAPIGDAVRSDDLRDELFDEPEGIRLLDCVAPTDPHVTDRLAARLDHPDVTTRVWAGYALSHRLPLDEAALTKVATRLDDPSGDMRARMRWILTVQPPVSRELRRTVAAHDPGFVALARPSRR